ncbi:D-alanyl-D-alanine carboxypeptidase / D-alanyl-D-alanine-endopeptidase (penicillin-binding protein 4) [Salinihabitans flavidus]|uniref:D-alanyl-D-alanine carboxypeptidase / D-alanyl-D-alanine-endopeptidase (Penicillin-binding protein 4) n=1 Tax=Salinihabitans flavidus TaxID=569882 RepID=A0A1H8TMT7_9RHOB|nr:D-alanyl-D-alanine carboxypeptidase/D-alanyl-D-alanine-endopeptidase [Salinihabitans flavidus]SEO92165.1 D-alanyl-D-alanine carboxypeptidase / D-alanyl-D-alanine-endopeptidase (penicillin-binding protein 4) [Salinihabitans flavidus]
MSKRFSRRFILGGLFSGVAGAALANAPQVSLRPHLRPGQVARGAVPEAGEILSQAGLSGRVSFAVAEVKSGRILEGHSPRTGLPPASVTKAITSLYALDTLGADHRFETILIGTGPVENGRLKGDLVLAGGGDPTLDTDDLAGLAQSLKAQGIHEVTGRFLIWGGALPSVRTIDPGQPEHVGYSPAISGLALNFNRVHFEWSRAESGWSVQMDARSGRYRPGVEVARMQVKDRTTPVYTYADRDGRDHWTVASGALGNGGARWLPVRRPEVYAGEVMQVLARSNGIVLEPPEVVASRPGGTVLARHRSVDLLSILRDMMKYSTNITAEMVGLSATRARGLAPDGLAQSAAHMSAWAAERLGMTNAALVDHSGLGDASRLHAGEMAAALAAVSREERLRPLMKPFVLRDANGRPDKSHPVEVQAKTGTLNFVSGLAGYMKGTGGTDLAFAIFVADTETRAAIPREARERPPGARVWNRKAKQLQQKLIERWGAVYSS